jgi:hypothetical protein
MAGIYTPIFGFPLYELLPDGTIRNARTKRVRKPQMEDGTYPMISLFNPDIQMAEMVAIHRLVALTLVPNPDPTTKIEVHHKDNDKTNYHSDNLEWTTRKENLAYAKNTERRPKKGRAVLCIDPATGDVIEEYVSMSEAARDVGLAITSNIARSMKYPGRTAGGYQWKDASNLDDLPGEKWKPVRAFAGIEFTYIRYSVSDCACAQRFLWAHASQSA